MRTQLQWIFIVICGLLLIPVQGKTQAPKTVVDFFLLLPKATVDPIVNFPIKNRRQILKEQCKLLDVPHGYLQIGGEADSTLTLCLFRKQNGSYLVASYYGGGEDDEDPCLEFFEYRSGHLVKTKPSLPVAYKKTLGYELPRIGTTIKVNDEDGKLLHTLKWNRTRFVLERSQSVAAAHR